MGFYANNVNPKILQERVKSQEQLIQQRDERRLTFPGVSIYQRYNN